MLSAILRGKAGRIEGADDESRSYRDLFRASEDLLTATVLERLAYLEAADFWNVLATASRPRLMPVRRVAELRGIEFWPRYAGEDDAGAGYVEPDAVLRFEVGDPAETWTIVVESKLGLQQNAQQWAAQWKAVSQEQAERPVDRVLLLALGGIGQGREAVAGRLADDARQASGLPVQAAAAGWGDLLDAVLALDLTAPEHVRLRADIVEAFALFGFRRIAELRDLPAYRPARALSAARACAWLGRLE